jgi:hypothetical protein
MKYSLIIILSLLLNNSFAQVDFEKSALTFFEDSIQNTSQKLDKSCIGPLTIYEKTYYQNIIFFYTDLDIIKKLKTIKDTTKISTIKKIEPVICKCNSTITNDYIKDHIIFDRLFSAREFQGYYYVTIQAFKDYGNSIGCHINYIFKLDKKGKVIDWKFDKKCD